MQVHLVDGTYEQVTYGECGWVCTMVGWRSAGSSEHGVDDTHRPTLYNGPVLRRRQAAWGKGYAVPGHNLGFRRANNPRLRNLLQLDTTAVQQYCGREGTPDKAQG